MRILFIRHGDPDYEHDTLTEKGHREAALLAERIEQWNVGDCFVSPLGRAQATASYSLQKLGITAQTMDWLREFPAQLDINLSAQLQDAYPDTFREGGRYGKRIVWDMLPSYMTAHPEYSDRNAWRNSEVTRCSDMNQVYDYVTSQFDRLLAGYGYVREGSLYRVTRENTATVTFFCHFGITAVLLSHLWSLSPFTMLHDLVLAPTSVTEVVTEERQQGIASFRGTKLGDVTHLTIAGEEPSFSARYCEVYSNMEQRH
ncbi:MAG: histidine phosphatase family protein [Lachnospiraceae bacterium]|nr:histidine phosphatase family protein [Lachnospiraceae bacterium]